MKIVIHIDIFNEYKNNEKQVQIEQKPWKT